MNLYSYANEIDSLKNSILISPNQASTFNKLAKKYRYINIDSSIHYAQKAIFKGHESNNFEDIAFGYFNFAINQLLETKYYAAIQHFNSALTYFKKSENLEKFGAIYNNLGNCYYSTGQYGKALDSYEKALEHKKKAKNEKAIAATTHNIGDVLYEWKKYNEALDFYFESLEYYKNANDDYHTAIVLNSIGTVYQNLKIFNKSLDYFNESLKLFEKADNRSSEAAILSNIGNIYYYDFKDYSKAEEYFKKSQSIYIKSDNKIGQSIILNSLGYISIKKGNFSKAENLFIDALNIAISEKNSKQLYLNHIALSELYETINNHKKALYHYKEYTTIKDSLFNVGGQEKLADFEAKYELFVKEKELETLKIKSDLQTFNLRKSAKKEITIITIICITILLLSYIVSRFYKPYLNKT
jgi:tetratricopeptide (TPR) repeat protein